MKYEKKVNGLKNQNKYLTTHKKYEQRYCCP